VSIVDHCLGCRSDICRVCRGNWYDAVLVLSLLVPAVLLGRWVYST